MLVARTAECPRPVEPHACHAAHAPGRRHARNGSNALVRHPPLNPAAPQSPSLIANPRRLLVLRRHLMQATIGDAAPPASKRAGLRSQRGPDSKHVLLKCNGFVSKVGYSEQPRGRPLKPDGDDDDDDDDGYRQLLLHAECHARFYTAPAYGATTEGSTGLVRMPGWGGSCAVRVRLYSAL